MANENLNQCVTVDALLSATVKYSNKDDASRAYDITANVRIESGEARNFESGEVRKVSDSPDNMEGMGNVATFNAYGDKNLNLYIHNAEEEESKAIVYAIYAFMADVRTNISINPVTA